MLGPQHYGKYRANSTELRLFSILLYFFHLAYNKHIYMTWVSQVSLVVKNLPASAGVTKDTSFIPGSERSLGGGHGNLLQ